MKDWLLLNWRIILVAAFFFSGSASPSKSITRHEAIGVLHYVQGGTGSGEMCFQTRNRRLCIDYENPYNEYGSKEVDRYKYGAIWRVTYHLERFSKEDASILGEKEHFVLDSMTFTGSFDSAVRSANELIYRHYSLLAEGEYARAYNNLTPALRAKQPYRVFVEGFRGVKFKARSPEQVGPNTFMRFSVPNYATAIVGHSKHKVVIDVDMIHFVKGDNKFYRFDVVGVDKAWLIDKVRSITEKQFARP